MISNEYNEMYKGWNEREREREKKNEYYIRNNILNITLYTYDISI